MSDGLAFHPIASIFPLFEGESLERLADDIRQNGLRESAWLFEGKILDGRNRSTACTMAGVKLETREFSGSYAEAIAFVWSENFHRRHLDSGQAAVADAKRVKMVSEYAAIVEKMKAEAKGRKRGGQGGKLLTQQSGEATDRHARQTSAIRAKMVGTNRRYIEAAESLLESAPEKLEAVEKGE